MRDLNSLTFDRPGRRSPDRSIVRVLCPKAQQMPAWRSCWSRHLMWCRRRRPRRRPRELERVPGVWRCQIHHPMNPRHTPPLKMRRRKKKPLFSPPRLRGRSPPRSHRTMSPITPDAGNSFGFPWPSSWPSSPAPHKAPEPAAPSIGHPLGLLVREPDS